MKVEVSAGDGTPALQKGRRVNSGNALPPKRRHLSRLERIFDPFDAEIYYITTCVRYRRRVLHNDVAHRIMAEAWQDSLSVHGWMVGRYVVMPDHVHFFASPVTEKAKTLSGFMGAWKHWTHTQISERFLLSFKWQKEFFDHLLRSSESYGDKWEYVRNNPVRAGLTEKAEKWPFQGEIHLLRK